MRKTTLIALIVGLLAIAPTFALDKTELTGGFSWERNDNGRSFDIRFGLDFPISEHFQLGPLYSQSYVQLNAPSVPSINVTSIGGRLTANFFSGANGLFCSAGAMYNSGDGVANDTTLIPECGFKFGSEGGGVRISVAQPYALSDEQEVVDLETLQVWLDFMWRF